MRCATSAIGSARCGGSTSRKRTGNSARSACQHGRISWSARWSACCLRRTTNRSSPTALTVSVPAGDATPHCGTWRKPGPRSPAVAVWSQLNSVRGDLVGDGAGVAGHGGRVGVDLVEEQFQGAGDAGRGGLLEGDGDRGGGEGDGSGQAADDGLAGDGAVFVVVTQVRSEERCVGKECRCRGPVYQE